MIKLTGKTTITGKTTLGLKSPLDIPGLQAWFKEPTCQFGVRSTVDDSGPLVYADDSKVARWEDQSGNGRHLTQSVLVNQPTLKTNIIGGKSVVRFDGNNSIGTWFDNTSNESFAFIVCRQTIIPQPGPVAGSARFLNCSFNNGDNRIYAGGGTLYGNAIGGSFGQIPPTDTIATGQAANTDWILLGFGRNVNANATFYINGVLKGSITPVNGVTPTQQLVALAGDPVNGTLTGDVAEVLVYSAPLPDYNRQFLENYLNNKWGIY